MTEQLGPKQKEIKNSNTLDIGHFERFRNVYLMLGEIVLYVVIFAVADGAVKEYFKIKSLSNAVNENSVSIATLPQATLTENPKTKTPEVLQLKGSDYIPDCYNPDGINELVQIDVATSSPIDNKEINLKVNAKHTQLDVVPTESPAYAEKVASSIVRIAIYNGEHKSYGTGFVAMDNNGGKVVVTAGHAVIGNMIDTIKVISFDDKVFDVVSGCKIYGHIDDKGQYIPVKLYEEFGGNNFDVAVLRLKDSDKLSAPLPISTRVLNKGELVYAINHQITTDGSIPAMNKMSKFYMIVGEPSLGFGFVVMLDGLKAENVVFRTKFSDRNLPGASGGPAFDSDGAVVGITYSTEERWHYLNKTDLLQQYNTNISSQDDKLIKPVDTVFSSGQIIKEAIYSPVLYNQSN